MEDGHWFDSEVVIKYNTEKSARDNHAFSIENHSRPN